MGGCCCCCCSSKGVELHSSPPFYHYPRVSEEHEPLSSPLGTASALSTGLLVDTNLETSILETYRPPPAPIPYDANLGRPLLGNQEISGNKSEGAVQTTGTEPVEATNTVITHESTKMPNKSEGEVQTNIELASLKERSASLLSQDLRKRMFVPPVLKVIKSNLHLSFPLVDFNHWQIFRSFGVIARVGNIFCIWTRKVNLNNSWPLPAEYDTENPKIITKCEHHFHLSCILEWLERSDTCPVCDKEMIFNPTINA